MFKYPYYFSRCRQIFNFLIPKNKNVLYFGFHHSGIVTGIEASHLVCVTECQSEQNTISKQQNVKIVRSPSEDYIPERVFDYIVLDYTLGQTRDICQLLKNIHKGCDRHTRLVIHQQNYLWEWLLKMGGYLGLKQKEKTQNWLSFSDLRSYLTAMGFEVTRTFRKTLFPVRFIIIGPLLNAIAEIFPLFDFLKLDQYIIARPIMESDSAKAQLNGVTICITVRNEKGNIEPVVTSLPVICENQELLFVEGHSTDGTKEEIERMITKYPNKNISLMGQPGKGQGDAIRVGFKAAKYDIILLFDGDGTHDPNDLFYFYDAMKSGRFEFIEGTRFVYPISAESMPLINKIGNILFAKWYTWFLGQHSTDVLSGIKAILKKDYEKIYDTWGFLGIEDPFGDFELIFGSARYGLKIGEIPMHYLPRFYGESKTKVILHGFYLTRMALNGYMLFRRAKQ